jgi:hypothetical protein
MPSIPDREFKYLKTINRFEALAIRQLMRRIGYKDTTYNTITSYLKDMAGRKLLIVDAKIQDTTKNKKIIPAIHLYAVGPEGEKILEADGIVVPRRNPTRSSDYWRHSMEVTNLLITTYLFEEQSDFQLTNVLTEYDIQRLKQTAPILVTLQTGETVRVEPDAIVGISSSQFSGTLLFEVEMGQAEQPAYSQKRWNEKLEKLIAFWEAEPGRDTLIIAVLAMRGEEQLKTLIKWTEAYLRERHKHFVSDHIRITATKPTELALFSDAVWLMPGVVKPVRLFD